MSERDELRERLSSVVLLSAECRCADDGGGHRDEWLTNPEEIVDAVLAEITKEHAIVPLVQADEAREDYECGDAVDRVVYGGASIVWYGQDSGT